MKNKVTLTFEQNWKTKTNFVYLLFNNKYKWYFMLYLKYLGIYYTEELDWQFVDS